METWRNLRLLALRRHSSPWSGLLSSPAGNLQPTFTSSCTAIMSGVPPNPNFPSWALGGTGVSLPPHGHPGALAPTSAAAPAQHPSAGASLHARGSFRLADPEIFGDFHDEISLPPVSEKRCSLEGDGAADPEAPAPEGARVDVVVQKPPPRTVGGRGLKAGRGTIGRGRGRGRLGGGVVVAPSTTHDVEQQGASVKSPNFTEGEVMKLIDMRGNIVSQRR